MGHFDGICDSPSLIYHSALPFSPYSSWLHKYYATELSQEVKVVKGLPAEWGICSRTVLLNHFPLTLACWKNIIAVGLRSGNIITLDGVTGIQTANFSRHNDYVRSIAFSPNGTLLVSGSDDETIRLWDVQTGGVAKIFYGHTSCVLSVSISADCTIIASGSADKTICLWNIQTEECFHVINQQNQVNHVRLSPTNPKHLIAVSGNKVWFWDISGHQTYPTHNGSHIAFSLNDAQIALCQGEDIVIKDTGSGTTVAECHIDNSRISDCCSSSDGRLIAVAAGHTVYVWDITTPDPYPTKTFVGHTNNITSLAFSSPSSLISSSMDKSVKFWEIDIPETDPVMADSKLASLTSAQVKFITLQAEDGIAISRDSEGIVRTWDISTGLSKASFQTPAKEPQWSDIRLINNQLILVWYAKQKIHIWDAERGELQMVKATQGRIEGIRISGDGSKVFCLSWKSIQTWSIQTGEVVGEVGLEVCQSQRSLTVDGSRVWVHSPFSEPMGWEFGISGSSFVRLSNTPLLHPNDTKVWDVNQSAIKDKVTGKVVFRLTGRFIYPQVSQWNGQYLVAGYQSGEVLILDFDHVLF